MRKSKQRTVELVRLAPLHAHNGLPTSTLTSSRSPSWSPWKKDICAEDALRPGGGDHLKERPSLEFRRRDRPQQAQKATPRRAARASGI